MASRIRDDRIALERLAFWREIKEEEIPEDRAKMRDVQESDSGPEQGLGDFEAQHLSRDGLVSLGFDYASGAPVEQVAARLDAIREDLELSLAVRQRATGGAAGFLGDVVDSRLMYSAADLALTATSFGRADIATTVLTHPAVAAVPARVFDALAVIHGVGRPLSDDDEMALVFDPWVKVGSATAGRRQQAFERYVRSWRAHMEKVASLAPVNAAFTGAWAFEAVVLAVVFDLDDAVVREVPEYPVDLADFARGAGLPRLSAQTRLPGPWKKPVAPKVIEPVTAREALAVVGEPGLAELAAVLSPVGGDRLAAGDGGAVLDAAVEAGTVLTVDARAMDPDEAGELVQVVCRDLGLPAPGRVPGRLSQDPVKALPKLDAWLETVGVRLLGPVTDTDDLAFFPVLAADYETFAGHTIEGLRLRTMDQLATEEA